jgi:hypothetical protein
MIVTIERYKGYYKVYGRYLDQLKNELSGFKMKRVKKYYILPFYNLNEFLKFLRDRKISFHIKNTFNKNNVIQDSTNLEPSNIKCIVNKYYENDKDTNSSNILSASYTIKIFTFIYSIFLGYIIYKK